MKLTHQHFLLAAAALLHPAAALAQGFDSGSDGSDGALVLRGWQGDPNILFDPADPDLFPDGPVDPEGDNIYHFTTIDIPSSITLRLSARNLGTRPVYWLAQGDVVIDGTLDLDGEDGHDLSTRYENFGGAGGYGGGLGKSRTQPSTNGLGSRWRRTRQ